MTGVTQLGYIGIGVSDGEAWKSLATEVLGLGVVPGDDSGSFYLRMDEYHHRVAVQPDGSDDVTFVGWEVPDPATLHAVAQRLEDAGVRVTPGTRDEAAARRVVDLIKFDDPSGVPSEIFHGPLIEQRPFQPSRPMTGFKAGDMGLGHVVVHQQNVEEGLRFYQDLLGFRVSDIISPGGQPFGIFMHCNPRHHSLALFAARGPGKHVHHFMLECNALDDVGRGRDLCTERGVPVVVDLGRHMNDHMVSFYMGAPSQFAVEYGWGARTIDDANWQVGNYESGGSLWGHPQLSQVVMQRAGAAS